MKERILWADDEIDMLKPHILFLTSKGYDVSTTNNGADAIEMADDEHFDLVFLDENMPGLTGLETLAQIKERHPSLPVIMITKSEEEDIMNQAIGGKIADYLIKPVNPNQILLSIKKNLHTKEIISEQNTSGYQQDFGKISMMINNAYTYDDWTEVYKKLVYWELELESADSGLMEMFKMQKTEANSAFVKFVKKNYEDWITGDDRL
jgi:Response regulator containing CheY-like receiver, AAA-type ATPase, and DNA-binding domains